jgi:hypothetical protein
MNRLFRQIAWQASLWSTVAAIAGTVIAPETAPAYIMGLSGVLCLAGCLALLNAADQRSKNRRLDS